MVSLNRSSRRSKSKSRTSEDRSIGSEGDRGPRSIRAPRHFELACRNAGFVHLLVDCPVLVDHEVQAFGHGIDGADADSVEATGDLVGRGIEFATGMEIRHDELCGTDAALLVHAHGNAASTVLNSQAPIREERHDDLIIEAGEMLVHGIVHHLPDAVVERIAVVRVTEVHPGRTRTASSPSRSWMLSAP